MKGFRQQLKDLSAKKEKRIGPLSSTPRHVFDRFCCIVVSNYRLTNWRRKRSQLRPKFACPLPPPPSRPPFSRPGSKRSKCGHSSQKRSVYLVESSSPVSVAIPWLWWPRPLTLLACCRAPIGCLPWRVMREPGAQQSALDLSHRQNHSGDPRFQVLFRAEPKDWGETKDIARSVKCENSCKRG